MNRLLGSLVLFSASLAVAGGLGELLVRLVEPQQIIRPLTNIYREDQRFGWRHRAGVDEVVNTGDRPARFVSDSHGYRINAPDEYPTPDRPDRRILAVGDSFIEGLMVDSEETMPKVLERLLNESGSLSVEVVNTGTAGWGPAQYLLQIQEELPRRDYDLGIVFLYPGNDFRPPAELRVADLGERHGFEMPRELSWEEIVRAWLFPINDFLEERSHLFVLLKNRLESLRARLGLTNFYLPRIHRTDLDLGDQFDHGFEMIQTMAATFDEHGVPVVFVLVPADYQVYERRVRDYAESYGIGREILDMRIPSRELAKRFLTRPDLTLVDLLDPLRAAADGEADLYGRIDKHLSAAGHRAAAEILLTRIAPTLRGNGTQ